MDDLELRETLKRIESGLGTINTLVGTVTDEIQENRIAAAEMIGDVKIQLALLTANVTSLVHQLPPIVTASQASTESLRDAVEEIKRDRSRDEWDAALKAQSAATGSDGARVWQRVVFALLALLAGALGIKAAEFLKLFGS